MTRQARIHWNSTHGKVISHEIRCDQCGITGGPDDYPWLTMNNTGNEMHYHSKGCYNAAAYLIEKVTGRKLTLD